MGPKPLQLAQGGEGSVTVGFAQRRAVSLPRAAEAAEKAILARKERTHKVAWSEVESLESRERPESRGSGPTNAGFQEVTPGPSGEAGGLRRKGEERQKQESGVSAQFRA